MRVRLYSDKGSVDLEQRGPYAPDLATDLVNRAVEAMTALHALTDTSLDEDADAVVIESTE